ncbi:D-alanyl-D-alanine carboxypeptidase [Caenispirillum bisanense]|uniref:D-alanyl-D-alanine carboxypeptidase n=1 Tax=Caenispirillum bisanense TaxID=414052 RepID=A0A286G0S9_9PROT|nr:D-alanyl-D-alanine carboxypeptidase [Caenispirillum bisanense]SOD89125.1 D-alanyl-D-alanine carboxypeptidase [Caenispirillum bisanense]
MQAALRVICFALVVGILTLGGASQAFAGRYASIVVDAATGKVLYSRNAEERLYPASLTKMMTLYMVFEQLEKGTLKLNSPLKASTRAAGMPPSKLGIKAGESITVEDAIRTLVTKSANDIAVVVAENLAGSEVQFAAKMTKKAHDLGMKRTTFRNASGLPNTAQLSTAEDMATLALALQKHFPQYYHYFATRSAKVLGRTLNTHNRVLLKYKGADGLKTGYINASGFNLVASAVRDGRRLVGVVFGGESAGWRDTHMMKLLDQGFAVASGETAPTPKKKPAPAMAAATPAPAPAAKPAAGAQLAAAAPLPVVKPIPGQPVVAAAVAAPAAAPVAVGSANPAGPAGTVKNLAEALPAAPQAETQVALALTPPAGLQAPAVTAPSALTDPGARTAPTAGRDGWGVQVGAYSKFEAAQMKAVEAADKLKRAIQGTHAKISTLRDDSGTIYRARVMGMSEREARTACDTLKRTNMACIIVPPDVNLALAGGKRAATTATD